MRLGIIGCGKIAVGVHLRACQEVPGVAVVAAADPTPERLELFRQAAGLDARDVAADYRALLERPDVDAVIVATPPAFRPPIVLDALAAGKHVLSEKPLALAPADAWALARAARAARRCLAVMHNYHFAPDYIAARHALASGAIGRPLVVTLNFLGVEDRPGVAEYQPRWRHDPRASGGGVLMDMLHAVYLLDWLMDGRPRAVSAAVGRWRGLDGAVEDTALCRFEYPHGFGLINMAWGEGPGGIEVMGTEGRLLLFYEGFGTGSFVPPEQLHVYRGGERLAFELGSAWPVDGVLRDFVAAVREGREPLAPGERGAEVLEAVVGAYASAALERSVALPLDPSDPVYQQGAAGLARLALPESSPVRRLGLFGT